ncbi:1393_t:CDS:2 [Dentiscutata erythropus]|uniref:1393_t:CDS:1 n=1 Tax=Dentiscutata erythropus TaxID=1348616 RepID=A0A9N8VGK6_9GLOM|nr:1393_t:CDS:2 [Dentiscutata erythropus]
MPAYFMAKGISKRMKLVIIMASSPHNPWQEIHSACNLEKPDNDYLTQCILNESKAFHNRLKFLENMESKLMPVEKLVKDILQHEKRHTLPRTWKDSNENTQYYG